MCLYDAPSEQLELRVRCMPRGWPVRIRIEGPIRIVRRTPGWGSDVTSATSGLIADANFEAPMGPLVYVSGAGIIQPFVVFHSNAERFVNNAIRPSYICYLGNRSKYLRMIYFWAACE